MAGLGETELGMTALGFGTPDEATAPPTDIPQGANFLNPRTGDYDVDDEGGISRMPTTRHRVLMLLKTRLGSAAYEPGVGLRLPAKIDQSFVQKAQQAVREALAPLAGDARIDAIDVKILTTGRVEITVTFTDFTTANSDTVTI